MFNFKLILVIGLFSLTIALPVIDKKEHDNEANQINQPKDEQWELGVEYERYLKEVVQALESDPEFRKKLESADVEDIKSGKIARELHLVDHRVRSKLDELKRQELERLRHLAIKEHEKRTGVDRTRLKIPVHVDHRNPSKFESEDLRKLILQLHQDLEKADKEREKEFKKYELEKEYEYKHQLTDLDEEHKQKLISEHEAQQKKHKEHPKLHHPGSKQQLEEVWEEQDHMSPEDFDPKTFFHLHDLDGNGYWDENEVKTLFQKELDKMYDPNNPEDDINERYEEMERMRSHVFAETDTNRDNLISYEEFVVQTKKNDFERDEGWQGLDEQEAFSQQEYEEYERQRQMEMQRLIDSGAIKVPPGYHAQLVPVMGDAPPVPGPHGNQQMLPVGYGQIPQGNQQIPPGYQQMPQGYQQMPHGYQQMPQGYQQMPPQGYQQMPQGYQQVPQGYQQIPQGYQQVPQGIQQVPQGYRQVPPQGPPPPQGKPGSQGSAQGAQHPVVPQAQAVPQAHSASQPISQAQSAPHQIPQAQAVHQSIPQVQAGSQGQVPLKKNPDTQGQQQQQFQQPPGVVLQNQQENLNQHPDLKPIENNHIN